MYANNCANLWIVCAMFSAPLCLTEGHAGPEMPSLTNPPPHNCLLFLQNKRDAEFLS